MLLSTLGCPGCPRYPSTCLPEQACHVSRSREAAATPLCFLFPPCCRFPAYGYPDADASVDELWESEGLADRYGNR